MYRYMYNYIINYTYIYIWTLEALVCPEGGPGETSRAHLKGDAPVLGDPVRVRKQRPPARPLKWTLFGASGSGFTPPKAADEYEYT